MCLHRNYISEIVTVIRVEGVGVERNLHKLNSYSNARRKNLFFVFCFLFFLSNYFVYMLFPLITLSVRILLTRYFSFSLSLPSASLLFFRTRMGSLSSHSKGSVMAGRPLWMSSNTIFSRFSFRLAHTSHFLPPRSIPVRCKGMYVSKHTHSQDLFVPVFYSFAPLISRTQPLGSGCFVAFLPLFTPPPVRNPCL